MSYNNPMAWWGLVFIIIPFAIYLLSRKKQDIIPFGTITFLEGAESHAAKSIFPSEWVLFLLRSLMIGIICFLLAGPKVSSEMVEVTYLEEGIYQSEDYATLVSELENQSHFHRFTFSQKEESEKVKFFPSAYTLFDYLNLNHPKANIYTNDFLNNYKGSPLAVSEDIVVHVVPSSKASDYLDTVIVNGKEWVLSGQSDEKGWSWNINQMPEKSGIPSAVSVSILSTTQSKKEGEKLKSMILKMGEDLPVDLDFNTSGKADIVFIIGDSIVGPAYSSQVIWNEFSGPLRLERLGWGDYKISGALNAQNLIKSNFTLALGKMLLEQRWDMNQMDLTRLNSDDRITLQEENKKQIELNLNQSISKFWWLVVFAVLGIERWFSHKISTQ